MKVKDLPSTWQTSFASSSAAVMVCSSGIRWWIFSIIGLVIGIRRAKNQRLAIFLWAVAGSLVFMTLLYGAWSTWSLGWSAGARWAADPFFHWALGLSLFCQYFLRRWPRSILLLLSTLTLIIGNCIDRLPSRAAHRTCPAG